VQTRFDLSPSWPIDDFGCTIEDFDMGCHAVLIIYISATVEEKEGQELQPRLLGKGTGRALPMGGSAPDHRELVLFCGEVTLAGNESESRNSS
jgi:hypothetical protein